MGKAYRNATPRVAMLYTRYPVASETFLQREAAALARLGLDFDALSLWPSPGRVSCEVPAFHVLKPWQLLALFWWIPFWLIRRPKAMVRIATALVEARHPNVINFWETMLGMGYGISRASGIKRKYTHVHAVWSSAPGTAAWVLELLTDLPYSMAGHAYDLFEDGGDGLLEVKIPKARFLRTSTEAGRRRWIELGARPDQVHVMRRGLMKFPSMKASRRPGVPVQLLAVGRLVEKMGYPVLLEVLRELIDQDFPFEAVFIGGGPLEKQLLKKAERLGLAGKVWFTGALPYEEVENFYREADLFLFGGVIAGSGDRAGFPNVIGEAMAWGVPVCARPVGAVCEAVQDGKTGILFDDPREAAPKIIHLCRSAESYEAVREAARGWVENEFDSLRNMQAFKDLIESQN